MFQSMYISFLEKRRVYKLSSLMVAVVELEEVEALVCPSLLSSLLAFRVHEVHSSA